MNSQARSHLPIIDVGPLFGPPSSAREAVDRAILTAAGREGFMLLAGLPADIPMGAAIRAELLCFFALPAVIKTELSRNVSDPSRPPSTYGWFARRPHDPTYHEGMDIGPDIAHGPGVVDEADALRRATPLPPETALPHWRDVARRYYLGMERVGDTIMRSLARGLGLGEATMAEAFVEGQSTLRLLRYPEREASAIAEMAEEELYVLHAGERRKLGGEAHTDYGFVTLLAQDQVGGLQARLRDGGFVDVPPLEGRLAVNFGRLLERWTSGRIRATEHRVLSQGRERFSIPFFYAPRLDARIAPLPLEGAESFEPFVYGDHAWSAQPRLMRVFGKRRAGQAREGV